MNTFYKIIQGFLTAILICLVQTSCVTRDRYITISGYAQGGTYTVKLNLNGRHGMVDARPEEIRDSIDSILHVIDNTLSGYNRNSLLSRFNAGETICPDSMFIEIYRHARDFFNETEGIVDVAASPLFDLWGFGFKSGDFPSDQMIEKVRSEAGMGRLKEDMTEGITAEGTLNGAAMLKCEGGALPNLNYNAIAQGYSCDAVAEYLYSLGISDMMVDIGEIFCDGLNPSGQPWTLGIDKPVDGNNEPGAQIQGIFHAPAGPHGIVTSGNYRKFYIRDGKKHAHSIDPRTGRPVQHNLLSATIVAPDAMTADAYATYCMVVGLEESMHFLENRTDLEGCLIYDDNGTFRTWCTEGFTLKEL